MGQFDKYGASVVRSNQQNLADNILAETKHYPFDNVLALSKPELSDTEQHLLNTILQVTNDVENPAAIKNKYNLNIQPGIMYKIPYGVLIKLCPHQIRNQRELKNKLSALRDMSIKYIVKDKKGKATSYGETSWLAGFKIDTKTWTVYYEFSLSLTELLMQWRQKANKGFTYKHIKNTYQLKKRGSIHLYNRLTVYTGRAEHVTLEIEELYSVLQQPPDSPFSHIHRRFLKPAIEEINKHTDIFVSPVLLKANGKIVSSIKFIIARKTRTQLSLFK